MGYPGATVRGVDRGHNIPQTKPQAVIDTIPEDLTHAPVTQRGCDRDARDSDYFILQNSQGEWI